MSTLNCLIIEDEPLAADILCDYIGQTPGLLLAGVCNDAFSGMERLRSVPIDLLFLDIHMPKLSGLELLRASRGDFQVILTTAHHEHALEGFDLDVTDYLLKPIPYGRFIQAINKAMTNRGIPDASVNESKHYFFNVDKKRIKVLADDILFIESLRDYVHIHTPTEKIITKFRIGELGEVLSDRRFLRIHKSYVVNLHKIKSHTATTVSLKQHNLPVGRSYKPSLYKELHEMNRKT